MLLNPDLDYPYYLEMKDGPNKKAKKGAWKEIIKSQMDEKKLPSHSKKYDINQATEWYVLWDAFEKCTSFTVEDRPTAQEVCKLLRIKDCTMPCRNIPLSCSQSTVMQNFVDAGCNFQSDIAIVDNDGTNS